MERVDCVVIGAGVIGLAVARQLAMAGREVIMLEEAEMIGTGTSSRNSEVIHAGIYYPANSFKARACVAGKLALYRYCTEHGVPHQRIGKLIVASEEDQIPGLKALRQRAAANGVVDLELIDKRTVRRLEPAVRAVAAMRSPSTGAVDSHGLMLAFQGDAEDHGAMIAYLSPVTGGRVAEDGIILDVGGRDPMSLHCRAVVNSAGLSAQKVAAGIAGLPPETIPPCYYGKGSYFFLPGKQPFTRLIYPMPGPASLGVHVTIDLGGRCRFGPDIEWVDEIDYDVDIRRADVFYDAIRTYFPDLPDGALQPDYAGIRPKIHGPGEPQPDFMIQGPEVHGIAGLVNLYGIESPGLTAAPVIAEEVAARLG